MVAPGVAVTVLEASLDWQEKLIEEAVNQEDETAIEADPYGMAVWPAGQVLAQAAAAWATTEAREWSETNAPLRAVEVGCGCGLASLALLSLKVHVTATDFRSLPLELLAESAQRQGLSEHLTLRRFDVRDTSAALPDADLVMASDVLYDRRTAAAMAVRADEALRRGAAVLVADIGRPNRKVFLERLRQLRPQEDIAFTGHSTAACRSSEAEASETRVELLQLPHRRAAAELVDKWPPALLVRPEKHKHVL
ncbi:Pentatricopeptide repeat-containing protein [Durusdinium trenchii]